MQKGKAMPLRPDERDRQQRLREIMESEGQGQIFALPDPPTGPESKGFMDSDGTPGKFIMFMMTETGYNFYCALERLAVAALDRGDERFSVLGALHAVRCDTKLRVNNSFAPWFADQLVEDHPRLLHVIQRKPRRKVNP